MDIKRKKAIASNPVPPSSRLRERENAAKLYEDFTGHDADEFIEINQPDYKTGLAFGRLKGVIYSTVRDGETEEYIHEFKPRSQPILGASHDGKQLLVSGGRYQFTDRGIIDK